MKIVSGQCVVRSNGESVRLIPVGERPLVELTTLTGQSIQLASECIFALRGIDGGVAVQLEQPQGVQKIDRPQFCDGFVSGLLLASGAYTASASVPAMIRFARGRDGLAHLVENMLRTKSERAGLRDKASQPWRIKIETGATLDMSSRLIDFALADAGLVRPVSLDVDMTALAASSYSIKAGFVGGLVANMRETADGRRFVHRSAGVVRELAEFLADTFAVPVDIHVNPAEPDVMVHGLRTVNPHHFRLPKDRFIYVKTFLPWSDIDSPALLNERWDSTFSDRVIKCESVNAEAYELYHEERSDIYLNNFAVNPAFRVPSGVLDMAAMDDLFHAAIDPKALLAAMIPDMTHQHGAL